MRFLTGRRRLLGLSVATVAAIYLHRVLAAPILSGGPRPSLDAFPAFLNTLIPADETPAASDLGIDHAIRADAARQPGLHRLIAAGCRWLDGQATRQGVSGFALLPMSDREAIVAVAARARPGSVPRAFFDVVRDRAMTAYYARPESWGPLGLAGPPQPNGYPDFDKPPAQVAP